MNWSASLPGRRRSLASLRTTDPSRSTIETVTSSERLSENRMLARSRSPSPLGENTAVTVRWRTTRGERLRRCVTKNPPRVAHTSSAKVGCASRVTGATLLSAVGPDRHDDLGVRSGDGLRTRVDRLHALELEQLCDLVRRALVARRVEDGGRGLLLVGGVGHVAPLEAAAG